MAVEPPEVLEWLTVELTNALGDQLRGLSVHGSYVAGDFAPRRSDLDLLAVLAQDPSEAGLNRLVEVHEALGALAPDWVGRVEVDYVSAAAVADLLAGTGMHLMARISPGEPLHLLEVSDHYLLNWYGAQQYGRVLAGSSPAELLPRIGMEEVRATVLQHVRHWPDWVTEAQRPGTQAYAVLTLCRAAAVLRLERQVSKRAAAAYGLEHLPRWSALISWARDWWYENGSDDEPTRLPEVVRFVREATEAISTAGQTGRPG